MSVYVTVLVLENFLKTKQNMLEKNQQEQHKKIHIDKIAMLQWTLPAEFVSFFSGHFESDLGDNKVIGGIFTEFLLLWRAAWEKARQLLGILKGRSARGQPTPWESIPPMSNQLWLIKGFGSFY